MADRVSYEQIMQELALKRALKPWEAVVSEPLQAPAPAATPYPMTAPDPMAQAQQREKLMQGLTQAFGGLANPESAMANKGKPNAGLLQMLMGLMR
jgi:hypothetical protein